eukprot:3460170-Prymnesium_polylepis.1
MADARTIVDFREAVLGVLEPRLSPLQTVVSRLKADIFRQCQAPLFASRSGSSYDLCAARKRTAVSFVTKHRGPAQTSLRMPKHRSRR